MKQNQRNFRMSMDQLKASNRIEKKIQSVEIHININTI